MNNKRVFVIFVVLLLLAMVPFAFTKSPEPYIFGWLPRPLLYWWILMIVNFVFVIKVARDFVKDAQKAKDEEDK